MNSGRAHSCLQWKKSWRVRAVHRRGTVKCVCVCVCAVYMCVALGWNSAEEENDWIIDWW